MPPAPNDAPRPTISRLQYANYYIGQAHRRSSERIEHERTPLVVIIGWLDTAVAYERSKRAWAHVHEYTVGCGCDVVMMHMTGRLLMPWTATAACTELLDIIASELLSPDGNNNGRPLILHVFSAGCYIFGELLLALLNEPASRQTRQRWQRWRQAFVTMTGLVAESPVQAEDSAAGLAAILTGQTRRDEPIGPGHKLLKVSLASLLWGRRFGISTDIVRALPHALQQIVAPKARGCRQLVGLIMYSRDDRVADAANVEAVLHSWAQDCVQHWFVVSTGSDQSIRADDDSQSSRMSKNDTIALDSQQKIRHKFQLRVLRYEGKNVKHAGHLRANAKIYRGHVRWIVRKVREITFTKLNPGTAVSGVICAPALDSRGQPQSHNTCRL